MYIRSPSRAGVKQGGGGLSTSHSSLFTAAGKKRKEISARHLVAAGSATFVIVKLLAYKQCHTWGRDCKSKIGAAHTRQLGIVPLFILESIKKERGENTAVSVPFPFTKWQTRRNGNKGRKRGGGIGFFFVRNGGVSSCHIPDLSFARLTAQHNRI